MTSNQVVRPSGRYLRMMGTEKFMWINAESTMFEVHYDDHFLVEAVLPTGDLSLRHLNSGIADIRVAKWTVQPINS